MLIRAAILLVLLAVLGFSVVGFLATFEPQGEAGGGYIAWRWLYRIAVLLSVVGIVAVFATWRRKHP